MYIGFSQRRMSQLGTSESFMHHPASDRCVPISALYDAILSVSFGGEYIGIAQLVTGGEINQTTSFIRSGQCSQPSLLAPPISP